MSRPTPETDAAKLNHSYGVVDIDFARKLERERDEVREKLRMANIEANAHQEIANALKERDEYKQERDEAREERDKLQAMRNEVVAANKGAKINAKVSNSLAAKLTQAWKERDEARKEAEYYKERYEQLKDATE